MANLRVTMMGPIPTVFTLQRSLKLNNQPLQQHTGFRMLLIGREGRGRHEILDSSKFPILSNMSLILKIK